MMITLEEGHNVFRFGGLEDGVEVHVVVTCKREDHPVGLGELRVVDIAVTARPKPIATGWRVLGRREQR
jgi:hypothetical protein